MYTSPSLKFGDLLVQVPSDLWEISGFCVLTPSEWDGVSVEHLQLLFHPAFTALQHLIFTPGRPRWPPGFQLCGLPPPPPWGDDERRDQVSAASHLITETWNHFTDQLKSDFGFRLSSLVILDLILTGPIVRIYYSRSLDSKVVTTDFNG